ncbi:hypothetical protein Asphe3_02690 [Pseudarthrobacter phenanthrenivorans Sphe3]|uniref:Uncharacterized protein n=1 Tax=Pseudarthrobacter phenanthrenivorans (strain DSM 18606 / JCM 16027 / LMG 23796 / Sphe3) TaxID=930171 RepID=F0M7T4_PSEPM|nr:hypothetical protein [Pseudarthrobacter phenanthrenivorans]ADX71487.1 hypothetical protein Asphe3_02690 [Pseudarthrobacter phenanthrenivorans Sphe3]
MNAEYPVAATEAAPQTGDARPDLSNANIREDLAEQGRCALVHLPSGRTCLLPLRHQGPCEFHRPEEANDVATGAREEDD